jgi:hypothetical protein
MGEVPEGLDGESLLDGGDDGLEQGCLDETCGLPVSDEMTTAGRCLPPAWLVNGKGTRSTSAN